MSKTVTYADFDLHKVKLTKKGLECVYYDKQHPNKEVVIKSFDTVYPDLSDAFNDVVGKEVFATSLQLLEGWDFARDNNRKNDEVLNKARHNWAEEVMRCEVKEVHYVGEEETAGIKFKGNLDCGGLIAKVDVPVFTFEEAEEELKGRAVSYSEAIKKEVWSYLFKNKKSQQELPLESDDEEGSKRKSGLNVA